MEIKNQLPSSITLQSDEFPGAGTSVDGLVSDQVGLVPQATGMLPCSRIWGDILFLDHSSRMVHDYLTQDASLESTLADKAVYEAFAPSHRVKVKRYHVDNCHFAIQELKSAVESNQKIFFAPRHTFYIFSLFYTYM